VTLLVPMFRRMGMGGAADVGVRGTAPDKAPFADVARVDVDELAFWVVADATGAKGEGSITQLGGRNAGNPDIDGGGLNVLGVLGSVGGVSGAKRVVGLLGAIAAKNLDGTARPVHLSEHGVEQVEDTRVVAFDFFVVTVAQELAEVVDGPGDVGIAYTIDNVKIFPAFACELELVLFAVLWHLIRQDTHVGQVHLWHDVLLGARMRMLGTLMGTCIGR